MDGSERQDLIEARGALSMSDSEELLERALASIPQTARAASATIEDDLFLEFLGGGRMNYAFDLPPLAFLTGAEEDKQRDVRLIGSGSILHWPQLDRVVFLPMLFDAYRDAHQPDPPWRARPIYDLPSDMEVLPEYEHLVRRMIPSWGDIVRTARNHAAWGALAAVILVGIPRGLWWLAVAAAIPLLSAIAMVSSTGLRKWSRTIFQLFSGGESVIELPDPDGEAGVELRQPISATILSLFVFGAAPSLLYWLCLLMASAPFLAAGATPASLGGQPWVSVVFVQLGAVAGFVSMFGFRWAWGHLVLWKYWLEKLTGGI
jgi:hypothetical protein